MKKTVLFFMIILISINVFASEAPAKLTLTTSVPKDYGIVFPSGFRIDNLVFSLKGENADNFEILEDGSYYVGSISDYPDGLRFRLLYYGNSAVPYDVLLHVDALSGWKQEITDENEIPIYIYFEEPASVPDGVTVNFVDDTNVHLIIDRIGPQRGLEVLDLVVGWDESLTAMDGEYSADLNFTLGVQ